MDREIMHIAADRLGQGTPIDVETVPTDVDLYHDIVETVVRLVRSRNERSLETCLILPVGPVGQYERLARRANRERLSFANVTIVIMDEYLTDRRSHVPYDHPLSFRRHMDERFYRLLDDDLNVPDAQRIVPDPHDPDNVRRAIEAVGTVHMCVAGVGINGHLAFNEPPSEDMGVAAFAALSTRVLELTPETRVVNAVTAASGDIEAIPRFAVTVGMKEILGAEAVRVYMNRPWQPAIARRWVHGPITARVPASLLQNHPDVRLVLTEEAARLPAGRLR